LTTINILIIGIRVKLHNLAAANYIGGVCAIVDIANHWIEIEMTQTLVIIIGAFTYIFYGNLFRINLKEEAAAKAARENQGSLNARYVWWCQSPLVPP
jgi:hypothetical protein